MSSANHDGKSRDEVIDLIRKHGTDCYDPGHVPFWRAFDVYKDQPIDLFAVRCEIKPGFSYMAEMLMDFVEGAPLDRGYSVRPDIFTLYDPAFFKPVPIEYAPGDIGEDAWAFLEPEKKADTLLGIVSVFSRTLNN